MLRGIIYARYSSENQTENSVEGQLRECKAFAESKDITVVGTYIDRALSAKSDRRPEFQNLISDSEKRLFDAVVVWKLDRFSRNRYDSAHYKAVLRKNGVKVISATEAISEGAEGILLESMLEGLAEYYSAELAVKVKRGLTENALKARHNGGVIPYGLMVDEDKHYQPDPLTAPIVREVFERYADGDSVAEITRALNARGIKTRAGNKQLTFNSFRNMIRNRIHRRVQTRRNHYPGCVPGHRNARIIRPGAGTAGEEQAQSREGKGQRGLPAHHENSLRAVRHLHGRR